MNSCKPVPSSPGTLRSIFMSLEVIEVSELPIMRPAGERKALRMLKANDCRSGSAGVLSSPKSMDGILNVKVTRLHGSAAQMEATCAAQSVSQPLNLRLSSVKDSFALIVDAIDIKASLTG